MSEFKAMEAENHMRLATKAMETSCLQWSPDYDTAADEFARAANAFKIANKYDQAMDALSNACDCYKRIRALYHAGKMLDQAALLSKEFGEFKQVNHFASRGAMLYRQAGYPDSAVQLLNKCGKILDPVLPDDAIDLYKKAVETVLSEDRSKQAADFWTRIVKIQVRCEKWDDAVQSLRQTIYLHQASGSTSTTGRMVASLVLVHLAREDSVAASNAYQEFGGYCDPELSLAMNDGLTAFDEDDADAAREALNRPCVKDLDVEITRMIKKIKLPDSEGLQAAAARFGAQRAAAMARAVVERDDELC